MSDCPARLRAARAATTVRSVGPGAAARRASGRRTTGPPAPAVRLAPGSGGSAPASCGPRAGPDARSAVRASRTSARPPLVHGPREDAGGPRLVVVLEEADEMALVVQP